MLPWFMNQIVTRPVLRFCQTRSVVPSPLKSPVPSSFQVVGLADCGVVWAIFAPPLSFQKATSPVTWFCHATPVVPGPKKAPLAMMVQGS